MQQSFDLTYLTAGGEPTLITAGVLAAAFTVITAYRGAYNLRQMDEIIVLLSLGLSAFASMGCAFYPLANLIALSLANPGFWGLEHFLENVRGLEKAIGAEVTSGILALRITSTAVGFTAIRSLLEVLRLDPLPATSDRCSPLFRYPEAAEVEASGLTVYRNRFAQSAVNLVQSGFYELNILLLWSIKFTTLGGTVASALLSWALFYIIDDWRIMFRLSLSLKGRFIKPHLRQASLTNWLITIAGVCCAWKWSILGVIVYLVCSYMLHRIILYVRDGYKGDWRIPGALNWTQFDQIYDHDTGERKPPPSLADALQATVSPPSAAMTSTEPNPPQPVMAPAAVAVE